MPDATQDRYDDTARELMALAQLWDCEKPMAPLPKTVAADFDWLASRLDTLAATARGIARAYRP